MKTARNILGYLDSLGGEMQELLKDLVQMESPSREPDAQKDILSRLETELQELNFHTVFMPGRMTGGYLYARPVKKQKGLPVQLLLGHLDIETAAQAGRLAVSTRVAMQTAKTLFPRLPLWRPPWDDVYA